MARDIAGLFKTELGKEEQSQIFHLVQLFVPGEAPLYLVDSNYDLVYDGITYVAFPVKFNGITSSGDGSINKATLSCANPGRFLQFYIETYNGLRNVPLSVLTISAKVLDYTYSVAEDGTVTPTVNPNVDHSTSAYIEDSFVVDSYVANENSIEFALDPVLDFTLQIPRRRFMALCSFRYLGVECGYSGSLTSCKKDLADCKAHNNGERYGGFPGVPENAQRRIYF